MINEKEIRLLKMAERGELPDGLCYISMGFPHLISGGKLTEAGKIKLAAHRWEEYMKTYSMPRVYGSFLENDSKIESLEKRVTKLEEYEKINYDRLKWKTGNSQF